MFKLLKQRLIKQLNHRVIQPVSYLYYKFRYRFFDPSEKTIRIQVSNITAWYRGNRYSKITFPGQIKGGDWSENLSSREEILNNGKKFNGIIQRYEEDIPWRETDLFKVRYQKKIDEGEKVHGFDNLDELENYYRNRYDKLFTRIQSDGILPASDRNPEIAPIYIHIGRDGKILFTVDGNHRLCFCMILGIEEIPVRVWMRHRKWQEKREYILGKNGKDIRPDYQEFLTHPDIKSDL